MVAPIATAAVGIAGVSTTALVAVVTLRNNTERERRAEQTRRLADLLDAEAHYMTIIEPLPKGAKTDEAREATRRLNSAAFLLLAVTPARVGRAGRDLGTRCVDYHHLRSDQSSSDIGSARFKLMKEFQLCVMNFKPSELEHPY